MNPEDNMLPIKIKAKTKGLEICRFGIVEYSVRCESGSIIALRD